MRTVVLFATAARFALLEHARNRLALVLAGAFVPLWLSLAYVTVPGNPAHFTLRSVGEVRTDHGNEVIQMIAALNAVTLITGFMMFAATFSSGRFDRRLAMAGYPRTHLAAAKLAALTLIAAAVAAYATVILCLYWSPRQPVPLAFAFFGAAMTYGVLGVTFGSVLRREVEGMVAVAMISGIDIGLQNPLYSSGAESDLVQYMPAFGAVQSAGAAAFSTSWNPLYTAIQWLWFAGAALLALLTFHRRTRSALPRSGRSDPGGEPVPASVP
ncbi:ABC transporter permease [Streptomyces sp. NPDC051018]|uniref:ABC transporter permease n=1 Tax=Streptomyces sp. NPDC051018 TaxID=3365639 RepID=UPI0037AFE8D7